MASVSGFSKIVSDLEVFDSTEKQAGDATAKFGTAQIDNLTVNTGITIPSNTNLVVNTLTPTNGFKGFPIPKADPTSPYILQIGDLGTGSSQIIGVQIEQWYNPPINSSGLNFGFVSELLIPSANSKTHSGTETGSYGTFSHFGSGALNTGFGGAFEGFNPGPATAVLIGGVNATANNGGVVTGVPFTNQTPTNNGNATNLRAFDGLVKNWSSGTVTNGAAFYAEAAQNTGGGAITNAYGLLVADQTQAVNNFAISTGIGKVSLTDVVTMGNNASVAGTMGVGTTPPANTGLLIFQPSNLSGATQFGIQSAIQMTSAATGEGAGGIFRADLPNAAFNQTLNVNVHAQTPTKGAAATITEWNGVRVDAGPTAGTKFAIKTTGTEASSFGGTVTATDFIGTVGATTPAAVTSTTLATTGLATKYNNISTVSNGIPSEYATVDLTGQTAAIGTTTLYAVPASGAGQYRVSWNAKVTTAAGTSSTLGALTLVYTDPDGVVQTLTCGAQTSAGAIATTTTTNTTAAVLIGLPLLLNCKASTNITYAMAYASNAAAAMNYNLHLKLEAL